ncbi:MAG: hypothetical protein ACERLM_00090 [Acidimicrobiales bacterium]
MTATSARWLAVLLALVLGVAVAVGAGDAGPATAQTGPSTTLEEIRDGNLGRIIPRPNSGAEPESPSDRGGWLQLSVLGVMVVGVGVIGGLVVRESRKAKADNPS